MRESGSILRSFLKVRSLGRRFDEDRREGDVFDGGYEDGYAEDDAFVNLDTSLRLLRSPAPDLSTAR